MKPFKYLLSTVLFCFLLSSCEEVITLDLKTGEEKYVIEAYVTNQTGGAQVAISKTKGFSASSTFAGESGATVTISDDMGNNYLLTESNKGIYTNAALKGVPFRTYSLQVNINGKTFSATSTMPVAVPIDAVFYREFLTFDGLRKMSHIQFRDPPGKGNYYRYLEYRNGVYSRAIRIAKDDLIDGNLVIQVLPPKDFNEESKLQIGDKIKIELQTIDEPTYMYWFSSDSGAQGGGSDSAAPINPVSNLKGGALGYFSAHTLQSKTYVVN